MRPRRWTTESYLAFVAALAVSAWIGNVLLIVLIAGGLGLTLHAAGASGTVRAALAAQRRAKQRLARRNACEDRLDEVGAPIFALAEPCALLDEIDRADDGVTIARFQLLDALDGYAELAIARYRAGRVLEDSPRDAIVAALTCATGARHEALARRLDAWDTCRAIADRADEQMAAILESLRAIAMRVAIPELPPAFEVEHLLAQLDAEDAARAELGAGVAADQRLPIAASCASSVRAS